MAKTFSVVRSPTKASKPDAVYQAATAKDDDTVTVRTSSIPSYSSADSPTSRVYAITRE